MFSEGCPIVNPKTIDSISAQVIPKADKMQQPAPIVLDAEHDAGKQQISRTQPSITNQASHVGNTKKRWSWIQLTRGWA